MMYGQCRECEGAIPDCITENLFRCPNCGDETNENGDKTTHNANYTNTGEKE